MTNSQILKILPPVKRLLTERDNEIAAHVETRIERDELRCKVANLEDVLARMRADLEGSEERSANLKAQVLAIPQPGDDEYDLPAAERLRDRMREIQPYIPITSAGVFSYSQHHQELFVLEQLRLKRQGFFVEVGVGTGVEYSNTHLLEKTFGWAGLLCEPNPVYTNSIRAKRSATLDTRAAYSKSGEKVSFLCVPGKYGLLSTITDFVASDQHTRYGEEIMVETVSLDDLLSEHRAPRNIDYMSLDTEGSEEKIISAFDFDKWRISVLTIEHNCIPGRVDEFDRILCPFAYKRVLTHVSAADAWYVRDTA